jgi:copper chaperone CopZ
LRLKVEISGMHCEACREAIEAAVGRLPGVTGCEIRAGQADLTFDEAQTPVARVLQSIRGAGPFDITSFDKAQ